MVLVEAIEEGLNSIGPSISDALFFYLQKSASIQPDQHAIDPEAFDDGLKKIFGVGAKIIEKKILEFLYLKLEAPQKIKDDFRFVQEVKKAQRLSDSTDLLIAETPQ